MKKLTIIGIMAAGALLFASCDPNNGKEPQPEIAFGELVSFGIYQADNKETEEVSVPPAEEGGEATTEQKEIDLISKDYVPAIAAKMAIILSDADRFLTELKARYEIKGDDVISVNGTQLENEESSESKAEAMTITGTFTFDPSNSIDIIVTNTKTNRSRSYTVDFKTGVGFAFKKVAEYTEENTELDDYLNVAVNPKDGKAYIAYTRKDTTKTPKEDGTGNVSKYSQASVIKWDGSTFDVVGKVGFSGPETNKKAYYPVINFDGNGVLYVAIADNQLALPRVMKFDGSAWVNVGGDAGFGEKMSTSYEPTIIVNPVNNNPVALYSGNNSKGSYYRTAFVGTFNGSTWDVAALANAPIVDGSSNVYTRSKTVKEGNVVYMLSAFNGTAENTGGYYIYKYESSAFSLIKKNFVSISHYGCISLKADNKGDLYAMAAVLDGESYALGLYSVSKETGEMTKLGGTIATMGNKQTVYFDFVADNGNVYLIFKDLTEKKAKFGVLGSEGVWSDFVTVDTVEMNDTQPALIQLEGKTYAVISFKNASTKKNNLAFYEIVKD